jgi:hypothetical protein
MAPASTDADGRSTHSESTAFEMAGSYSSTMIDRQRTSARTARYRTSIMRSISLVRRGAWCGSKLDQWRVVAGVGRAQGFDVAGA